jgi:glycosyltransferase involved in cell wall biosynthesis
MKKIILLGPSAPYRGGFVHFNAKLGETLINLTNLDTTLIFWKRLYPTLFLPKPEKEFQDLQSKVNFKNQGKSILDYLNPLSWIKLALLLKRIKPDVFITYWTHPIHFPVYFCLFSFIKILTHVPIYLIAHNVKQHEGSFLNKLMTRITFYFAKRIIVHAKQEAKEAENLTSKEKLIVAFHPIYNMFPEDKQFSIQDFKRKLNLQKHVLLFFGFIRPYKGLEYLIEAFKEVSQKIEDVSLLIVGELFWKTDKKQNLATSIKQIPFQLLKKLTLKKDVSKYNPLKLIKKYNLSHRCTVVEDYVPNEDVFKYFKVSDILVAPYISASQSGPVQIAYAFNKPVIVTRVGGLKDAVKEKYSGYTVKPKRSKDLADKIIQYITKDEIKTSNIKEYKKRFFWDKYIRLITDTL